MAPSQAHSFSHHLSFSLQVLLFRPVGSLFFLLVSPFCSSQAQAELSLLTPLSSLRNRVIPSPFPSGWNFHAGGSSSQCGDLPPATLPIDSTGPRPHPPSVQPLIFILSLVQGPFLFSSLYPLPLGSDLSSRKDGLPSRLWCISTYLSSSPCHHKASPFQKKVN